MNKAIPVMDNHHHVDLFVRGDKMPRNQYDGTKCPNCGNDDFTFGNVDGSGKDIWLPVTCKKCLASWNECYRLVGYDDLSVSEKTKD